MALQMPAQSRNAIDVCQPGPDGGDETVSLGVQELQNPEAGKSQRDGAIVAWHEVPWDSAPQKSRPVGYGVIRAG
jgi:hypothetical protein